MKTSVAGTLAVDTDGSMIFPLKVW
jgi:hypothetical protein